MTQRLRKAGDSPTSAATESPNITASEAPLRVLARIPTLPTRRRGDQHGASRRTDRGESSGRRRTSNKDGNPAKLQAASATQTHWMTRVAIIATAAVVFISAIFAIAKFRGRSTSGPEADVAAHRDVGANPLAANAGVPGSQDADSIVALSPADTPPIPTHHPTRENRGKLKDVLHGWIYPARRGQIATLPQRIGDHMGTPPEWNGQNSIGQNNWQNNAVESSTVGEVPSAHVGYPTTDKAGTVPSYPTAGQTQDGTTLVDEPFGYPVTNNRANTGGGPSYVPNYPVAPGHRQNQQNFGQPGYGSPGYGEPGPGQQHYEPRHQAPGYPGGPQYRTGMLPDEARHDSRAPHYGDHSSGPAGRYSHATSAPDRNVPTRNAPAGDFVEQPWRNQTEPGTARLDGTIQGVNPRNQYERDRTSVY